MADHEWQGLALAAFGAVWIALTPRMHRDPLTNDPGWQRINASRSRLGPRFGRSAYRAVIAFRPWLGPLALLFGFALFLDAPRESARAIGDAFWFVAFITLVVAVVAALSVFLIGLPNLLLPAGLRGQPGFIGDQEEVPPRVVGHMVTVHDVRPGPEDSHPRYFLATCTCGWLGKTVNAPRLAFDEARGHDPNVEAKVFRPIG